MYAGLWGRRKVWRQPPPPGTRVCRDDNYYASICELAIAFNEGNGIVVDAVTGQQAFTDQAPASSISSGQYNWQGPDPTLRTGPGPLWNNMLNGKQVPRQIFNTGPYFTTQPVRGYTLVMIGQALSTSTPSGVAGHWGDSMTQGPPYVLYWNGVIYPSGITQSLRDSSNNVITVAGKQAGYAYNGLPWITAIHMVGTPGKLTGAQQWANLSGGNPVDRMVLQNDLPTCDVIKTWLGNHAQGGASQIVVTGAGGNGVPPFGQGQGLGAQVKMRLFAVLSNSLTPDQVQELGANPWQLWGWVRRRNLYATASIQAAETGTGTDAATTVATTSGAEVSAGTDTASIVGAMTAAEVGSGLEVGSLAAAVLVMESGGGLDAGSIAAVIKAAEAGAGFDVATVAGQAQAVGAADAGAGLDQASINAAVQAAEMAAGADIFVVAGAYTAVELGSGVELAQIVTAVLAAEVGAGTEGASVQVGNTLRGMVYAVMTPRGANPL